MLEIFKYLCAVDCSPILTLLSAVCLLLPQSFLHCGAVASLKWRQMTRVDATSCVLIARCRSLYCNMAAGGGGEATKNNGIVENGVVRQCALIRSAILHVQRVRMRNADNIVFDLANFRLRRN